MKRRIIQLIGIIIAAIGTLILGVCQPTPGKHNWLTNLSGDWSIRIGDTAYEIGAMTDNKDRFEIFHYATASDKAGMKTDAIESDVRNVWIYAYRDSTIVALAEEGFVVIEASSGAVRRYEKRDELPQEATLLSTTMSQPRASHRSFFFGLTGVFVAIAAYRSWRFRSPIDMS